MTSSQFIAEHAKRKRFALQHPFPVREVFDGTTANGLMFAVMRSVVGLPAARLAQSPHQSRPVVLPLQTPVRIGFPLIPIP